MKNFIYFFEQLYELLKDPIIVFFTTFALFVAPIAEIIFAAILFALLDFITALVAAYKKRIPITSEKMGHTFPKIILYSLTIIFTHYLDTFLVQQIKIGFIDHILNFFMDKEGINNLNQVKLTAAVAFLILIRECKSIDENWESFFGWSFFKTTISYIVKPILKLKTLLIKHEQKQINSGSSQDIKNNS